MKPLLRDISIDHLAFVTGHKITKPFRVPSASGMVQWCYLDGKRMRAGFDRSVAEEDLESGFVGALKLINPHKTFDNIDPIIKMRSGFERAVSHSILTLPLVSCR
jgi:hypothetical protein